MHELIYCCMLYIYLLVSQLFDCINLFLSSRSSLFCSLAASFSFFSRSFSSKCTESLGSTPTASIAEKHGIEYPPFHAPKRSPVAVILKRVTISRLTIRYNLWLEVYLTWSQFLHQQLQRNFLLNLPKSYDDLQKPSLVIMVLTNNTLRNFSDYWLVVWTPPGARKPPKPQPVPSILHLLVWVLPF